MSCTLLQQSILRLHLKASHNVPVQDVLRGCFAGNVSASGTASHWQNLTMPDFERILAAQDVLNSVTRPFAGMTNALPTGPLVAGGVVLAALAGIAAWRFTVYSRREYIVAAMLRKYVPKGESTGLCSSQSPRDTDT